MKYESTKYLLIFITLVFIDQLSKYLIRSQGGFYICNPNIAFGIKFPIYIYWTVITILAVFAIVIIINYKFKILNEIKSNKLKNLKLIENLKLKIENYRQGYFIHNTLYIILILSGAISNIIDRARFGCVIDFIDLKYWPVFNLADVFITIGVIILIVKLKKAK